MTTPARPTDCGCCAGTDAETPARIDNAPGLAAIAYRVGRARRVQGSRCSPPVSADYPALAGLRTRDDDDFTHRAAATRSP